MTFREAFGNGGVFLMEGAIGTRLVQEYGIATDSPAALAVHVRNPRARKVMAELYGQYLAAARQNALPFLANTPTRRATRENIALAGLDADILADNVLFLRELREEAGCDMYLGGTVGCRGNAYDGGDFLDEHAARDFHIHSAEALARAGVDYLYAGIMPNVREAAGLARACAECGPPLILSFMLSPAGTLLDGTSLHDAIGRVDDFASPSPLCYVTNCVHPGVVASILDKPFNRTDRVRERFLGVMPNASTLPPDNLDKATELHAGDQEALAEETLRLASRMRLRIVGGCCGTDHRFIGAVGRRLRSAGRPGGGNMTDKAV